MRIVRFAAAGQDPAYGILELEVDGGEHPDSVATLTNDPLAGMAVNYTGERHLLDDVRLLSPVIPRSRWCAWAATTPTTPRRWAPTCLRTRRCCSTSPTPP